MSVDDHETRLRETLDSLATTVETSPDAYAKAHSEWQRRDRRRRLVMLVLTLVILAVADIIGLWALNSLTDRAPSPDGSPIEIVIQP